MTSDWLDSEMHAFIVYYCYYILHEKVFTFHKPTLLLVRTCLRPSLSGTLSGEFSFFTVLLL